MKLKLSDTLSLPLEAATQTFLVVGKRGSGKSNTSVRLAEQFYHAHIPFVAIDPVDNWHGLKTSRDGKHAGLGVYVFGGSRADLPLEANAGELIADTIIEHRFSCVLSVKHLSGRERGRFVGDFAKRLFQKNSEPLHLFLEEAHEVAPQNPYKGEEEMLGHVSRLWKLGRSSGLGGSAITQRPASLSKNITTQAEILVVHRTLGPQDVAAIREWIKYHGEREDILSQLSTLKTGEAFIWAPDFPEGNPIGLQRVSILLRETFDSAATPKAGEKRIEPRVLADVDLEKLKTKMAATIERAKAEDPRELRKQIAELKKQVLGKTASNALVSVHADLQKARKEGERQASQTYEPVLFQHKEAHRTLRRALQNAAKVIDDALTMTQDALEIHVPKLKPQSEWPKLGGTGKVFIHKSEGTPNSGITFRTAKHSEGNGQVGRVAQGILNALAELEQLGAKAPKRTLVAFLAGYSNLSSTGFAKALSSLSTDALVYYPGSGLVALTDAGRKMALPPPRPRSPQEVQGRIIILLGGVSARILEPIIEAYPKAIPREQAAAVAGYTNLASTGFAKALSRLSSLGFIEYPSSGQVKASPVLFLEEA